MKDTLEKQESDTWDQFLNTGRVEDYLRYAVCRDVANAQNKLTGQVGDSPHAGFYTSDGNYIKTDAYR